MSEPPAGGRIPRDVGSRGHSITSPTPAALANALPDFALAALFLATWLRPAAVSADMLGHLTILMALEFVVVHSAGFMGFIVHGDGPRGRRTVWMVALIGFYSLFAGAFSLAARAWWPLVSFTVLGLNRTVAIWFPAARRPRLGAFIVRGWVMPTALYLGLAFLTTLAPVPRFGVTGAIAAAGHPHGVGGLWTEQPWRVLAFGFLYYLAVAVVELSDPGAAEPGLPSASD